MTCIKAFRSWKLLGPHPKYLEALSQESGQMLVSYGNVCLSGIWKQRDLDLDLVTCAISSLLTNTFRILLLLYLLNFTPYALCVLYIIFIFVWDYIFDTFYLQQLGLFILIYIGFTSSHFQLWFIWRQEHTIRPVLFVSKIYVGVGWLGNYTLPWVLTLHIFLPIGILIVFNPYVCFSCGTNKGFLFLHHICLYSYGATMLLPRQI